MTKKPRTQNPALKNTLRMGWKTMHSDHLNHVERAARQEIDHKAAVAQQTARIAYASRDWPTT